MSANPFEEGPGVTTVNVGPKPGSDEPGIVTKMLSSTKLDTILKMMRVFNILNGLGLGVACYFAFTVIDGKIPLFFLALYIGIFSVLLVAFELRFSKTEPFVKRMFGFMYSYIGRTMFLIFVGAINFGFIQNGADTGAVGTKVVISLGAITLLNAFFNCLVLCKHPAFKGGAVAESKPLSDEEMLAYIRAHPELLAKSAAGPSSGKAGSDIRPAMESNPFEASTPVKARAPERDSGYNPPVVPRSPPPPPVAAPAPAVYDDGENPFAQ